MVKNGEAPGRNIAEGFTLNYHYILREKTFAELVGDGHLSIPVGDRRHIGAHL